MTPNIFEALEEVVSLGCERVLSSGGEANALDGALVLQQMVQQAADRISIMPGGGINQSNLQRILTTTGAKEFHCSARTTQASKMEYQKGGVAMGASLSPPEFGVKVTCDSKVKMLLSIAQDKDN